MTELQGLISSYLIMVAAGYTLDKIREWRAKRNQKQLNEPEPPLLDNTRDNLRLDNIEDNASAQEEDTQSEEMMNS